MHSVLGRRQDKAQERDRFSPSTVHKSEPEKPNVVGGKLSNCSRFSPYQPEAALHTENIIIPNETLTPKNQINAWAVDPLYLQYEGPRTPYSEPTESVVGTSVFWRRLESFYHIQYIEPLLLTYFWREESPRCKLCKDATSKPRNGPKLHGPDCFCSMCLERIFSEGTIRTTAVPARRTTRNRAPPQDSLRAKHQRVPMRYTARSQTRFSASKEDDVNALTPQAASATVVFERQVSLQPHWKQGWKNFFRHIKTRRRPDTESSEMRRSTFRAYCHEIRRTQKVEYSLLASLQKLYNPPRARPHRKFAIDMEPVDELDVERNDDELSNANDLVGSMLNNRIRVVAFLEQDEHNKVYLTKNLLTDVYYEMRAYAFDNASNKEKKILWRDCQKRRRSRRFLEVLKHEGKTLLLFRSRWVTFGRTSYLLGPGGIAIEGEKDSDEGGDGKAQVYKPDDGSIDLGNLMEFPPLPTAEQAATEASRIWPKDTLTIQTQSYAKVLCAGSPRTTGHREPTTPTPSQPLQDLHIHPAEPSVPPGLSLNSANKIAHIGSMGAYTSIEPSHEAATVEAEALNPPDHDPSPPSKNTPTSSTDSLTHELSPLSKNPPTSTTNPQNHELSPSSKHLTAPATIPLTQPLLNQIFSPSPTPSLDDLVEKISARLFTAENLMRLLTRSKPNEKDTDTNGLSNPLALLLDALVKTTATAPTDSTTPSSSATNAEAKAEAPRVETTATTKHPVSKHETTTPGRRAGWNDNSSADRRRWKLNSNVNLHNLF